MTKLTDAIQSGQDDIQSTRVAKIDIALFHSDFDQLVKEFTDPVREAFLEADPTSLTPETFMAQFLMNGLVDDEDMDRLTVETKQQLVKVASHLGPDWAQAIYHAAVFMTKVA